MTDAELITFCQDFRDGLLGGRSPDGMCFMICAPLVTLLNLHGVACELVETTIEHTDFDNHVWLRLADGRALDPTADQFSRYRLPPVYLGPLLQIHGREVIAIEDEPDPEEEEIRRLEDGIKRSPSR
jgi:hypothetical protein